jgi:hypothetical protein
MKTVDRSPCFAGGTIEGISRMTFPANASFSASKPNAVFKRTLEARYSRSWKISYYIVTSTIASMSLPNTICVKNSVGSSMLAKVVNDDAGSLTPRGVLWFFASMLAPTVGFCLSPATSQCWASRRESAMPTTYSTPPSLPAPTRQTRQWQRSSTDRRRWSGL